MAKKITEHDIIAELRASEPPRRAPGWYTLAEIIVQSGKGESAARNRLRHLLAAGRAEKKIASVVNAGGSAITTTVYRLKP